MVQERIARGVRAPKGGFQKRRALGAAAFLRRFLLNLYVPQFSHTPVLSESLFALPAFFRTSAAL